MHVHDDVPEFEEGFGREWFSKEVRQVVRGVDVLNSDDVIFNKLSNVEVTSVDVFRPVVEFGVVCQFYCSRVVNKHFCR